MGNAVICLAVAILSGGCKHNPVDAPPKNPREYTWTIETISYPGSEQTFMWDMYAVDAKDIWIVGHNARAFGKMYHFDGSAWTPITLSFSGPPDLTAIAGFGRDNIWAVGVKWPQDIPVGFIIHFDGTRWSEVKVDGTNLLLCVWGSGPTDVWFGGLDGTLLHFDGVSIKPDSVPRYIPKNANPNWGYYAGASGANGDGYVVLVGVPFANYVGWSYTFRRQSGRWVIIDSANGVINRLWSSPWGKLYRTGYGIGYWDVSAWRFLDLYGFTRGVYGVAEDNLFAVGTSVWHWNGSDWFEFTNLPLQKFTKYKVWTDGREVFIVGVGIDDDNSYVLHGR